MKKVIEKERGVKKLECEKKGFFKLSSSIRNKYCRIQHSVVRTLLLGFDTWQEFLRILMYWVFFGFILSLPAVYFGLLYGAIYPYAWWGMWAVIMIGLAIREERRSERAKAAKYKLIQRPNALAEYKEMLKPKET